MADDINKDAKRSWGRIFSIFGVSTKTPTKLQPSPSRDFGAPLPKGTFSDQELEYLPGFSIKRPSDGQIRNVDRYFSETSDRVSENTKEIQKFKVLTPEIGKAKMVLVPTIMSPNDVQTDSITISVNSEEVEPEIVTELNKELTTYFNNELKLSSKVAEWIGDALFESGSKPVFILPKGPIRLLSDTIKLESELEKEGKTLQIGVESIRDPEKWNISEESLFGDLVEEDMHSFDIDIEDALYSQFDHYLESDENGSIKSSLEAMAKAVKENKKKLKERAYDIFTFSTDYRSVVKSKTTNSKKQKALNKKILESIYGTSGGRLFVGSDEEDVQEGDHPTLMPMPSEAVIPVAVPGDPSSHIGYFILMDDQGNPLDNTGTGEASGPYSNKAMKSCSNGTMNEGVQIVYGSKMSNVNGMSKNDQFEAASTIFGITIKKMLEKKLRDNDLDGLTIQQHQAITTTLFQRLIRKAKVKIVFVPSTMVAYYAFDYRKDGTGKSLLEEASFLISLRNTMIIANVLTAIKNSTDRTRIEFNVGDQATNVEQIMDILKESYVSKRMLNFEHDPLTVARDLIQNSIQMVPKGLRGLEDLNVTTENTGGNVSNQPDTEMMEKLSELVTLSFNIPPSALNRLSEDEYSRSIATTNLFFANEIRIKQGITCEITTQLVRQYILGSRALMNRIIEVMKVSTKDKDKSDNAKEEAIVPDDLNDQSDKNLEKLEKILYKVINSIYVELPTPNIAATKAQYEELREATDTIDQLVNRLFDEETIGIDDNDTKEAYGAIKGFVRQVVLRKIASELGPHGSVDIPTLDNIDQDELVRFNQAVINTKRNLQNMRKLLDKTSDEEGGGSRW